MALGISTVSNVRQKLDNIDNAIKYGNYNSETEALYSCWNTFDYVSKSLGEWANDTVIGQESKQSLTQLSGLLLDLIEETRRINDKIVLFCDKQDNVNGTKKQYKAGDLTDLP